MSLKHFHIVFIVSALGLMVFLAWWSGSRIAAGLDSGSWAVEAAAAAGLLTGIVYLAWYRRESRSFR